MDQRAAKLAKFLLEIHAVKLNPDQPFTWTSGIQSPIYCDNRMVLSFPDVRDLVKNELAAMTTAHFPDANLLAGIATAGIAHGALAADVLNMPYCYVRPEPKKHGLKNQIEGRMQPGDKVVLIEDLISTGKSSLQAADAVREAGGEVVGLLALFTYGFR
ncbi:MAG: orotate phosphoribosyltransferase, partial [Bacteroidetes bacterium]|nr:orotate phosphoribosyltransferase [Bacteroidota bacterium]